MHYTASSCKNFQKLFLPFPELLHSLVRHFLIRLEVSMNRQGFLQRENRIGSLLARVTHTALVGTVRTRARARTHVQVLVLE